MPAKKQVTQEDILEAALALFREKGMGCVNARELARALGCSTQPIYLSFSGMEELKTALTEKLWGCYRGYLDREIASGVYPLYKSYGMGYIRFAKEEREMFRYLFMRPRSEAEQHSEGTEGFEEIVTVVAKHLQLPHDVAMRFHMEQWVFVHGVASMLATSYLDLEWDKVSEMMTDVYDSLRSHYIGKGED